MSESKKAPLVGVRLSPSLAQEESASACVRALSSIELVCSAVVCPEHFLGLEPFLLDEKLLAIKVVLK